MAQRVKNPPAMWETWVQSLDWEDALEKGKATNSSILAWRISWTVAHQAPPSMGFSRQEHWSGLPFLSPIRYKGLIINQISVTKKIQNFKGSL